MSNVEDLDDLVFRIDREVYLVAPVPGSVEEHTDLKSEFFRFLGE